MTHFNLLTNPFYLLAVDPAATNQQIDSAAMNGTLGSELDSARIAILDPAERLSFELSYPIDSPPDQIAVLNEALLRRSPASEILLLATDLGALSRANLIAHLAADQPASAAVLGALVKAHAAIEIPAIYAILRSLRAAAGWVAPSLVNVNEGVQALLTLHTRTAIAAYGRLEQAAEALGTCIRQLLAEPDQYHLEALARLVAAYREHAGIRLAADIDKIQDACAALVKNPGDIEGHEELATAARDWVAINLPLTIFDDQNAADEEVAVCADHMRDVIGDLVDAHFYDVALSVAQSARDAFAPMPDTAAEFDKAIALIEQWSRDASPNELQICISKIASDTAALDSVLETGFGPQSIDGAKHPPSALTPPPAQVFERIQQSRFAREEASSDGRFRPAKAMIAVTVLVGAFGTAAVLHHEGGRLRSLMAPPSVTPGQSETAAEIAPTVGTGQHLELSGVRYCHYQEERLKIMKPEVKSPDDARAFNLLVVDYNSRCSDFFFKDADLAAVKAEIAANGDRLEADAKAIISTWPGHTPVARN